MTSSPLEQLSDRITEAHRQTQAEHDDINPVVGVNRQMRTSGIPADAITIDCLQTNRRILLILHDHQPELIRYQFGYRDRDPGAEFETLALTDVTERVLIDWIVGYFREEGFA